MRRVMRVVIALLASVSPSFAGAGTYVLGDSIGDGLATTMGFNNLAEIGIHIRGPKALGQIARTPPGSTVYIFLGTNDAEGSLKNIDASIDDVLNAAARRKLTVIWVGPHCVRKDWDIQASMLDDILRKHLAKANVTYISTRANAAICSGQFQEPDGVHFTAKGYRTMWAMIESTLNNAPATAVASAAAPQRTDADTTASIAAKPDQARLPDAGAHRLVMDIHVPGSPSEPLLWTRNQN
jgi:lysophospholipase L1-like esterase